MLRGQGVVLRLAHHGADVARRQQALHLAVGGVQHRVQHRGHPHVAHQQGQVGDSLQQGSPGQQGRCGSRGFEANGQEHHQPIGMVLGHGENVEGAVHHAHIAALGPHRQQVAALAARYPQHVAEGAEDHLGPCRQLQGLVDPLAGGNAHGTAGAVDEANVGG